MAFEETPPASSMNLSKMIGYSLIGGIIVTIVTSIMPNNTAIGASNSGYPFPWLSQPLYPIGIPPTIIWEALAIDGIAWTIAVFVLLVGYKFFKSR